MAFASMIFVRIGEEKRLTEGELMNSNRNFCNARRNRHWIKRSISAIFLIAFPLALSANANASELAHAKQKTIQLYMKKYEKNNVVFYSGSSLAKTTKISSEEYFKGAPYVCTPSGFGRTSHCHNRSAF